MKWQDRRLIDLFGIEHPIIQAPMAGAVSPQMAIAAAEAGGLGSIPAAMLTPETLRTELQTVKQGTSRPINVNFFVHADPVPDEARDAAWRRHLGPYYQELGLAADAGRNAPTRAPFSAAMCDVLLEFKPRLVSFHFGLPEPALLKRIKDAGLLVTSSATSAEEARWLEDRGCDVVIAQGNEAGGHRGMFLNDDIARQAGTMALVPQVVDAVKVPVIAAGGIGDGRGIVAALALGAAGVQIGTALMLTPEAKTSALHRAALKQAHDGVDQRLHRPAGARHRQSLRPRGRADQPARTAVPAGRRCQPADAPGRRSQGHLRLHGAVERPGPDLRPRDADGRAHGNADPGDGSGDEAAGLRLLPDRGRQKVEKYSRCSHSLTSALKRSISACFSLR
jgi:nitronate monooxygenase